MKITVIGAGNIGTQVAVHAAAKGHSVYIFTVKYQLFSTNLKIVDDNGSVLLEGLIKQATADPDIAFLNAEVLIITLPPFCQKEFAEKYVRYANEKMILCFFPGTGGCECTFQNWVNKGATILGLQRVPSVARIKEYGKIVRASGYRNQLYISCIPSDRGREYSSMIMDLFDIPCLAMPNYLNVTLTPSNAILHTTRLYSLFKDYKKTIPYYDTVPLFYEEWDLDTSTLLLKCDKEVQNICAKLSKFFDLQYVKSLKDHYESKNEFELKNKICSIKGFKGLTTPVIEIAKGCFIPDLNSRYFKADFPYGLRILQEIGCIMNVPTPTIDIIWEWYKTLCPSDVEFNYSDFGISSEEEFIEYYKR